MSTHNIIYMCAGYLKSSYFQYFVLFYYIINNLRVVCFLYYLFLISLFVCTGKVLLQDCGVS